MENKEKQNTLSMQTQPVYLHEDMGKRLSTHNPVAVSHTTDSYSNQLTPFSAPVAKWFFEEELQWRSVAVVIWEMVFLPLVLSVYVMAVTFSLFRPIQWLSGVFSIIFSGWFIMCSIVLQLSSIALLLVYANCSKVYKDVQSNTFQRLLYIIRPKQLMWILWSAGLGFVFSLCFVSLLQDKYSSLTVQLEGRTFLNEYFLFLSLFGVFLGFGHSIQYFTKGRYVFTFPSIQEIRFFRVKAELSSILSMSFWECLKVLRVYYPVYFIFGPVPRDLMNLMLGLDQNKSSWSAVVGLLDLSLLIICVVTGSSILFSWYLFETLYNVFYTQICNFPVEANYLQDKHKLLKEAIRSKNNLLRFHAFLDLSQLSKYASERRKQLFELTQPGGRPETWTIVSSECLFVIEMSKKRFIEACLASKGDVEPLQKITKSLEMSKQQFFQNDSNLSHTGTPLGSIGSQRPPYGSPTVPFGSPTVPFGSPAVPFGSPAVPFGSPTKIWSPTSPLSGVPQHGVQPIKRRDMQSGIEEVDSKRPKAGTGVLKKITQEARIEELFKDHRLVLWTLEGLSNATTASLNEDTFGVVQKTLPDILTMLLSFLEAIEAYIKTTIADNKPTNLLRETQRRNLKCNKANSLKLATQTAIYNIATTFGHHLNSIKLSPNHKKRLYSFLEFRE